MHLSISSEVCSISTRSSAGPLSRPSCTHSSPSRSLREPSYRQLILSHHLSLSRPLLACSNNNKPKPSASNEPRQPKYKPRPKYKPKPRPKPSQQRKMPTLKICTWASSVKVRSVKLHQCTTICTLPINRVRRRLTLRNHLATVTRWA